MRVVVGAGGDDDAIDREAIAIDGGAGELARIGEAGAAGLGHGLLGGPQPGQPRVAIAGLAAPERELVDGERDVDERRRPRRDDVIEDQR